MLSMHVSLSCASKIAIKRSILSNRAVTDISRMWNLLKLTIFYREYYEVSLLAPLYNTNYQLAVRL